MKLLKIGSFLGIVALSFGFFINNIMAVAPTNGLISYWNLDDGTGAMAQNMVTGAPNGTLVGNPVWNQAGRLGGAVDFSGTNYINTGDLADGQNAITVSAWFRASAADTSHLRMVFESNSIDLRRNSTERFSFQVFNPTTSVTADSDVVYADTSWHHVVGVYDGANVDLYVDGVDVEATPKPLTGAIRTAAADLTISASYAGVSGTVDEVRIYNRALTPAEIIELYTDTGSGEPTLDTEAPSIPNNLVANPVSYSQINLSWNASTDNTTVSGYKVFRDGIQVATSTALSYQDTNLVASTTYSYTVSAYDPSLNVSGLSNIAETATPPMPPAGPAVVVDHRHLDVDQIPDYWIDQIKTNRMFASVMGASHARQFHYGLQLLEAQNPKYSADVNYSPSLFLNENSLRDLTGRFTGSWTDTGGADTYWLNDAARTILRNTVNQSETVLGYPMSASIYGWSYHMCSPSYASSSIGHPFSDADLQQYLNTLSLFNGDATLSPTEFVYTTSVLDGACNTTTDNAYNTRLWNEQIRQAAQANGGYLFDQADIENWNNTNTSQYVTTDYLGRTIYLRNSDYQESNLPDTYTGDHTNDALELRKAKALWWLMARMAGWDGVGTTTPECTNCRYINPQASGSSSGLDWDNAFTSVPSNLERGFVYYLAEGNYNSHVFDDAANGTQYITLKKATSLDHGTDTGWNDLLADQSVTFGTVEFVTPYWRFSTN